MEKKYLKKDYGSLTDASRSLNKLFGDTSGRTVSRRTTHGFKRAFNIKNMSDENAEHIVHGTMASSGILLASKNSTAKVVGLVLLAGLFTCYHNGE